MARSWLSRARRLLPAPALAAGVFCLCACAGPPADAPHDDHAHSEAGGNWQVTVWGEAYEVFPEVGPLVAGGTATAHTHVTVLDGFAALEEGVVSLVLRGDGGAEEVFAAEGLSRPGVFEIAVTPAAAGERDLLFRIRSAAGSEEIRGGRVQVGTADRPGGLLVAPAPRAATVAGEPVELLKEQQWRTEFGTRWVRIESISGAVEGPGVLRAPAGGEAWLTAPVAGVVLPEPWPWPGQAAEKGQRLLRITPQVEAETSLGSLRSDVTELEAEVRLAEVRRDRARRLAEAGVVSRQEQDEAEAEYEAHAAQLAAARQDLRSASAARSGGGSAETLTLRAPFDGQVSRVEATPGSAVEAGARLARLVVTDPLWVEVALSPDAARRVAEGGPLRVLLEGAAGRAHRVEARGRFVSRSPEVDTHTGAVPVLLEIPGDADLPIGARVQARILLSGENRSGAGGDPGREGTVVPESSLVDDGGEPVVYLQLSGERFVRQAVEVVAREGDRVLVEGLLPGQRLVTRGGPTLRRTALVAGGGAGHGHAH